MSVLHPEILRCLRFFVPNPLSRTNCDFAVPPNCSGGHHAGPIWDIQKVFDRYVFTAAVQVIYRPLLSSPHCWHILLPESLRDSRPRPQRNLFYKGRMGTPRRTLSTRSRVSSRSPSPARESIAFVEADHLRILVIRDTLSTRRKIYVRSLRGSSC